MKTDLIKIFTGEAITVEWIKAELEMAGIGSLIKNDFVSGTTSGFSSGVPSAVDLFVSIENHTKAVSILKALGHL